MAAKRENIIFNMDYLGCNLISTVDGLTALEVGVFDRYHVRAARIAASIYLVECHARHSYGKCIKIIRQPQLAMQIFFFNLLTFVSVLFRDGAFLLDRTSDTLLSSFFSLLKRRRKMTRTMHVRFEGFFIVSLLVPPKSNPQ